ncbi:hypothetical protein KA119_00740 [Candidatus Gracilibacteria bacterium]|nr:hypothetical protein [Candidatus Gracilibacteria bacterium]
MVKILLLKVILQACQPHRNLLFHRSHQWVNLHNNHNLTANTHHNRPWIQLKANNHTVKTLMVNTHHNPQLVNLNTLNRNLNTAKALMVNTHHNPQWANHSLNTVKIHTVNTHHNPQWANHSLNTVKIHTEIQWAAAFPQQPEEQQLAAQ